MAKVAMLVWNEFRNDARVLKEAQTLQAAGYAVTVFALHTPGVTSERETLSAGINVVRVARSPFWRFRKRHSDITRSTNQSAAQSGPVRTLSFHRKLLRIVARLWTHWGFLLKISCHRASIVHAHDVNTLPTAWLAAKISGARIVYDAHEISTSREGYAGFRRLVGVTERLLMPRVHGAITTTNARAKFFARAYGVSRPLVLQNRPRFTSWMQSSRIRHELSLAEPWPIVLYQGGLQQGRGLERLVRSAARVEKAYFVFIGGGRLAQPLMRLVDELGLEQRVRFIPTVSLTELPSYTASADIGVQPIENTCLNHFTTDSNKLFEYLIAGLPVIASDLPEIRHIVRANGIGLLVKPGSEEQLAEALGHLVSESERRAHMQKNSLIAARSMNWEQQEGALLELYRRILGGEPMTP